MSTDQTDVSNDKAASNSSSDFTEIGATVVQETMLPPAKHPSLETISGAIEFRVVQPGAPVRRLRLTGNRYTFGSGQGCSIQLSDDSLRPMHAVLLRDAHRILVRAYSVPLEFNGTRATESTLRIGDVIRMGNYRFELLSAPELASHTKSTPVSGRHTETTDSHLRAKITGLSEQWHARHAECEARESRCDQRETHLRGRESELWQRAEELRRRETDLITQESAAHEILNEFETTQQELSGLRESARTQRERLQAKEEELKAHQAAMARLEQQYDSRAAETARQFEQSKKQVASANAAVETMRQQFAAINEKLTDLNGRHEALGEREKEQREQQKYLQSELESARAAATDARAQCEDLRSQADARAQALLREIDAVKSELQAAEDALREANEQADQQKQELETQHQRALTDVQQRASQAEQNIAEAQQRVSTTEQRVSEAENRIAELTAELEATQATSQQLQIEWHSKCEAAESRAEQLAGELDEAKAQCVAKDEELEKQAESHRAIRQSNETVVNELTAEVQRLQASVANAQQETSQLRMDYEGAQASIRQLELLVDQTKSSKDSDYQSWVDEAEQLRQSVEQLSVDLARANAELSSLKESNQTLTRHLEETQAERDAARAEAESRPSPESWQTIQDELTAAKEQLQQIQTDHDAAIARLEARFDETDSAESTSATEDAPESSGEESNLAQRVGEALIAGTAAASARLDTPELSSVDESENAAGQAAPPSAWESPVSEDLPIAESGARDTGAAETGTSASQPLGFTEPLESSTEQIESEMSQPIASSIATQPESQDAENEDDAWPTYDSVDANAWQSSLLTEQPELQSEGSTEYALTSYEANEDASAMGWSTPIDELTESQSEDEQVGAAWGAHEDVTPSEETQAQVEDSISWSNESPEVSASETIDEIESSVEDALAEYQAAAERYDTADSTDSAMEEPWGASAVQPETNESVSAEPETETEPESSESQPARSFYDDEPEVDATSPWANAYDNTDSHEGTFGGQGFGDVEHSGEGFRAEGFDGEEPGAEGLGDTSDGEPDVSDSPVSEQEFGEAGLVNPGEDAPVVAHTSETDETESTARPTQVWEESGFDTHGQEHDQGVESQELEPQEDADASEESISGSSQWSQYAEKIDSDDSQPEPGGLAERLLRDLGAPSTSESETSEPEEAEAESYASDSHESLSYDEPSYQHDATSDDSSFDSPTEISDADPQAWGAVATDAEEPAADAESISDSEVDDEHTFLMDQLPQDDFGGQADQGDEQSPWNLKSSSDLMAPSTHDEIEGDVDPGYASEPVAEEPAVDQLDASDASASEDEPEDDSIEAYMNRLLQRVQGEGDGPSVTETVTKSVTMSKSSQPVEVATSQSTVPPVVEPPAERNAPLVPRSQAPERNSNMSAMRDLANQSARNAVERSVRMQAQKLQWAAMGKFGVAVAPLVMAVLIVLFYNNSGSLSGILKPLGIFACFALTGFFAYEGWTKLQDAKSRLAVAENGFDEDERDALDGVDFVRPAEGDTDEKPEESSTV